MEFGQEYLKAQRNGQSYLLNTYQPTTVFTANGEVQTQEEATVYVTSLDSFVTVKLLDDTPAVLSLGKLCQDHRYSYEWTTGQKPQLIKDGRRIKMQRGKLRTNRCPWFIDKLFKVSHTHISCISIAGSRASRINKK